MKAGRRKASEIYLKQNTVIHKGMARIGMPYHENRETWLSLAAELCKRPVAGLSEMTLAERHLMIAHFQKLGYRIFAPAVPVKVRDWRKGNPDIEYEFREDDDPQIRMVYAMWAEMGYRQKTLRGLCFRRFHKDDPRWLNNEELCQLVNIVQQRANRKGVGTYYKRQMRGSRR